MDTYEENQLMCRLSLLIDRWNKVAMNQTREGARAIRICMNELRAELPK